MSFRVCPAGAIYIEGTRTPPQRSRVCNELNVPVRALESTLDVPKYEMRRLVWACTRGTGAATWMKAGLD